ncbi:ModD protein [Paracoccus aminophilus]|uniref:Putative pyrophosphorylase ModD n=1 Tax=Paracoccus aminophilus JCM 7686 TaxID=1367847 RepID=S5Y7E1_PARAH|nr:ModD protein [Paracoccus aminophilus]AGT07253.1 molybdenum transport protein [Paracoccus aminophilus JCM 7686]
MSHLSDAELQRILNDDCPYSDPTTEGLGIANVVAQASLTARYDMTVCASEEAARMFELVGARAEIRVPTGGFAPTGTCLLQVEGSAAALHRSYKMAQTLMEILSGMASSARAIVQAAEAVRPDIRVACTRKHMPGMKTAALRAIEAGGAVPHRLGLSDFVLIFEEHRTLLDAQIPLARHFARLRAHSPERRLAVEASGVIEAVAFAEAGAEIVQVDKASPEEIAEIARCFDLLPQRPLLAAAGGINAGNAAAYTAAGADILVTSAPYYAPPKDVKVRIFPR